MNNNYKSEGIILSTRNYSETDKILVLFTKHFGKQTLIAKGTRKLTSRKRGSVEIFSHVKFSATRGKSMGIITEIETISTYNPVRKTLKKVSLAYYFAEVILKTIRDEEKNKELYDYLLNVFSRLEKTKELKKLRLEFIKEALVILGFWPASRPLLDPDYALEKIMEKKLTTVRVGKELLK